MRQVWAARACITKIWRKRLLRELQRQPTALDSLMDELEVLAAHDLTLLASEEGMGPGGGWELSRQEFVYLPRGELERACQGSDPPHEWPAERAGAQAGVRAELLCCELQGQPASAEGLRARGRQEPHLRPRLLLIAKEELHVREPDPGGPPPFRRQGGC